MNPVLTFIVAHAATAIAKANNALTAFGDIPFSDHLVKAKENPEPTGYAKRIQLVSKGKLVDTGKCPPGQWAIVDGEEVTPLGKAVDIVPLAVLDKALDTSGDEVEVVFGRDSEQYQEIAERSTQQDSGCMHGPCFLVWERTQGEFFEIFFNNKSGRMEAPKLNDFLPISKAAAKANGLEARGPAPANLSAKYIEKPRYSWFAPQIKASQATFDKTPSAEAVIKSVTQFLEQANVEEEERDR